MQKLKMLKIISIIILAAFVPTACFAEGCPRGGVLRMDTLSGSGLAAQAAKHRINEGRFSRFIYEDQTDKKALRVASWLAILFFMIGDLGSTLWVVNKYDGVEKTAYFRELLALSPVLFSIVKITVVWMFIAIMRCAARTRGFYWLGTISLTITGILGLVVTIDNLMISNIPLPIFYCVAVAIATISYIIAIKLDHLNAARYEKSLPAAIADNSTRFTASDLRARRRRRPPISFFGRRHRPSIAPDRSP